MIQDQSQLLKRGFANQNLPAQIQERHFWHVKLPGCDFHFTSTESKRNLTRKRLHQGLPTIVPIRKALLFALYKRIFALISRSTISVLIENFEFVGRVALKKKDK